MMMPVCPLLLDAMFIIRMELATIVQRVLVYLSIIRLVSPPYLDAVDIGQMIHALDAQDFCF
jgi:hypothetical protein